MSVLKFKSDDLNGKIVLEHKLAGCPRCQGEEVLLTKEQSAKISSFLNKETGRVEDYRMCKKCSILWTHAEPGKCCGDCAFKPNSKEEQEGFDPSSVEMFLCHTRIPLEIKKGFARDYKTAPEVRICKGFQVTYLKGKLDEISRN